MCERGGVMVVVVVVQWMFARFFNE